MIAPLYGEWKMNYTEFRTRLRRQHWIEVDSPAAVASFRYGGNQLNLFKHGLEYGYRSIIELREKDWKRMNGRKNKGFVPNIKFVDCELTTEGKAAFKQAGWSVDDTISFIERMGNEGYKIGARYDGTNGAWLSSLVCNDTKSGNFGWCLSARGQSFLHAFAVLAYKHEVLLQGDWTTNNGQGDDDSGWG